MNHASLSDEAMLELQSVQAIFSNEITLEGKCHLVIQCAPDVQLKVYLPLTYPSLRPSIELCAPSIDGENRKAALTKLETICEGSQSQGEPILYALIGTALDIFAHLRCNTGKGINPKTQSQLNIAEATEVHLPAVFHSSETIEDRKSRFQAHVAKITSKEEVPHLLAQLKSVSKIARATNNTVAWRLVISSLCEAGEREYEVHDCDDGGEDGAGPKLLKLLKQMDARGVLVVVSRWYGGRHIGPDRFRHICNAARDALISGEFVKIQKNQ